MNVLEDKRAVLHISLVFARKNQERSFRVAVIKEFTDAEQCTRNRAVAFKVKYCKREKCCMKIRKTKNTMAY